MTRWSMLAVAAVVLAVTAVPTASAQTTPTGTGTTTSTQSVLSIKLGDLLGIEVLGDQGSAVTQDTLSALARITGIRVSSAAIPSLNVAIPIVEASQPNGTANASNTVSLGNLLPAELGDLLSGDLLPLDVSALLGDSRADANGLAKLTSLDALTSLLHVEGVTSSLAQTSAVDATSITRLLNIDALSVLNLDSLLSLLGIDLTELSVDSLLELLNGVGLEAITDAVTPLLDTLQTLVTQILTQLDATVESLTQPLQDLLGTLLGPLPGGDTLVGNLDGLFDAVDGLVDQVIALLEGVRSGLGELSLLNLDAIQLGATAKATDTTSTSSATATCSLGGVQVLNLEAIPLSAVTGALGGLGEVLTGVLDQLPFGLGNLLNLSVCGEQILGSAKTGLTHEVSSAENTVTSTASASAIELSINTSVLDELLGGLLGDTGDTLGDLLGLDAIGAGNPLTDLLGGVTSVLSEGLSVRAASVDATATHVITPQAAAPATPVNPKEPVTPLADTGGEALPVLLAAAILFPLVLFVRRRVLHNA